MKKLLALLLTLALVLSVSGCAFMPTVPLDEPSFTDPDYSISESTGPEAQLDPDADYYSKEDVALFIHSYGELPRNFITKSEAKNNYGGNKNAMAQGYRIGGDRFGNYEGLLPKKTGRSWTECDIAEPGATSRGAKRIVFSNDGLVYYTDDHYESFTLLYGEP